MSDEVLSILQKRPDQLETDIDFGFILWIRDDYGEALYEVRTNTTEGMRMRLRSFQQTFQRLISPL